MICQTCHQELPEKAFDWQKSYVRKKKCKQCELANLVSTEKNGTIATAVKLLGAVP